MGNEGGTALGASPDRRITPPANPTYGSRSFRYSRSLFIISPSLPSFLLSLRHSGESRNPEDPLKRPFVSIPASRPNGTPSIGVTSNLDPAQRTASGRCRSGVHPTVRRPYARPVRGARHDGKRHRAGEGAEKMETGLEGGVGRETQSFVAGSVGGGCLTGFRLSPE